RQNDKCQDTDNRTDVVVLFVYGQFVQPCYKQVSASCRGFQIGNRISSRQQVDNVEVVDVSCKCCNQVWCRHIQHVRKCDLKEDLHCIGAVHSGGLVKLTRNILKDSGQLKQCIWYTNPDI